MRAVTFNVSVPRYLAARSLGRISDTFVYGRLSGVRLREVALPPLPGPRWARLSVLKAGICGTDLATFSFSASPAMEPFGSFPAVPGHEVLARVEEVGEEVLGVEPGMRVVVDPMLSCEVREVPEGAWCASCVEGRHSTCENAGERGPLEIDDALVSPGLTMGYHRSLPGGWGEMMVAHESQLFPVDEALDDRAAVLVEPLSVGLHAVLNTPSPPDDEPVLVIGSGPIALGTVWALRATGFHGELVAQAKREHEARLARLLGASRVVTPGAEARSALVDTGAKAYMPLVGEEVFAGGGFPVIFDCVGSQDTLDQSLRYAAPRGRIVLLGCAAHMRGLDLTFLWARELDVKGFVGYGRERVGLKTVHTFQATLDLMLQTGAPLGELVTHVFPLSEFRSALSAAARRGRSEAMKVVLEPD